MPKVNTECRILVRIVEPMDLGKWQEFVDARPEATSYHHAGWFHVLRDCPSVTPLFLLAQDEESRIQGVCPMYFAQNFMTGRYLTTLEHGPLVESEEIHQLLLDFALKLRDEFNCKYLLVRSGPPLQGVLADREIPHGGTVLSLLPGSRSIWRALSSNMRRKINKAQKNGFRVEENPECLKEFYSVYARTLRDLGTPVVGLDFFYSLRQNLGEKFRLFVIWRKAQLVGGMICLESPSGFTNLYTAVKRHLLTLYPTYLLYWFAMDSASRALAPSFDFGRSILNGGVHRFKMLWGSKSVPLNYRYYFHNSAEAGNAQLHVPSQKSLRQRLWSLLPLGIANRLGPWIRHGWPFS